MGCSGSIPITEKTIELAKASSSSGKTDKAIRASILIQSWFRRYKARLEAQRRCTWKIFQEIEYGAEQDQINLYNFFNDMVDNVNNNGDGVSLFDEILGRSQVGANVKERKDSEILADIDDTIISEKYGGPHLDFPLTPGDVDLVLDLFKEGKTLPAKYVKQILFEAKLVMKTLPNVSVANISISRQITVCGDLHGKLEDLLTIFHKNGLPSSGNPYIFNGDFIDRGPHSLEILIILCCFFLLYPHEVYLNRGNHEDHIMNTRYGFTKEITEKYKKHASKIRKLCRELFGWLPLATIVGNKILVVHGGISDKTDLEEIMKVRRSYFLSVLKPSHVSTKEDSENMSLETLSEWEQVLDMLWSDPQARVGKTFNKYRGGGCCFGPDVTESVLQKHGWDLLIRSHECKYEGYEYTHNGKVLTVFSASSYYAPSSNFGAYAKIGVDLKPRIVQFSARKFSPDTLSLKHTVGANEESAIRELKEKMFGHRELLTEAFEAKDTDGSGMISVQDWSEAMESVLKLKLPWTMLCSRLAKVTAERMVEYMSCLEELSMNMTPRQTNTFSEAIYRNRSSLETVFRIIDKDCSGVISKKEFEDACRVLNKYTKGAISESSMSEMVKTLDINKDGQIDFNEFLEAFRLVSISVASNAWDSYVNDKMPHPSTGERNSSIVSSDDTSEHTDVKNDLTSSCYNQGSDAQAATSNQGDILPEQPNAAETPMPDAATDGPHNVTDDTKEISDEHDHTVDADVSALCNGEVQISDHDVNSPSNSYGEAVDSIVDSLAAPETSWSSDAPGTAEKDEGRGIDDGVASAEETGIVVDSTTKRQSEYENTDAKGSVSESKNVPGDVGDS